MQPSRMADTSRLLLPSLRFFMAFLLCRKMGFKWGDSDRRRPSAGADHWAQVLAVAVLRSVGIVDSVISRPIDRLECDFFCQAGSCDPSGFLTHRGLIPARVTPVVSAHIKRTVKHNGPDPRRRAVGRCVLAER